MPSYDNEGSWTNTKDDREKNRKKNKNTWCRDDVKFLTHGPYLPWLRPSYYVRQYIFYGKSDKSGVFVIYSSELKAS